MSAHFRRVTIILAEMIRVSKGVCSVLSTDSDFFKENMTILILVFTMVFCQELKRNLFTKLDLNT